MTEFNQFGSLKPGETSDPQGCAACEAMLTDVIDGTLSAEEQTVLDLHVAGCPSCREMLADAQRGAAWMELLRDQRPQPSADLVGRILAQTTGSEAGTAHRFSEQTSMVPTSGGSALMFASATSTVGSAGSGLAGYTPGQSTAKVIPFSRRVAERIRPLGHAVMQPRLAMTAAMAFVSVALTLDLTGVRLRDLRASDLKPASLRRSFYNANAHVARYCDNLRAVYELESRVHDLQRSSDEDTPRATQAPANRQGATGSDDGSGGGARQTGAPKDGPEKKQQAPPRRSPGTSLREPLGTRQQVVAMSRGVPEDSSGIAERFASLVVRVSKEGGLA